MALSDLKFDQGLAFKDKISKKFGVLVNFIDGRNLKEFFLVAEFSRFNIKLNEDSVELILQSCFGGHASRFMVTCCQNWSFMFSVASKDVGFAIYHGGNTEIRILISRSGFGALEGRIICVNSSYAIEKKMQNGPGFFVKGIRNLMLKRFNL